MPCWRIDAASRSSSAGSKTRRGCSGFGRISATGSSAGPRASAAGAGSGAGGGAAGADATYSDGYSDDLWRHPPADAAPAATAPAPGAAPAASAAPAFDTVASTPSVVMKRGQ